jgi:hypothetical protein
MITSTRVTTIPCGPTAIKQVGVVARFLFCHHSRPLDRGRLQGMVATRVHSPERKVTFSLDSIHYFV